MLYNVTTVEDCGRRSEVGIAPLPSPKLFEGSSVGIEVSVPPDRAILMSVKRVSRVYYQLIVMRNNDVIKAVRFSANDEVVGNKTLLEELIDNFEPGTALYGNKYVVDKFSDIGVENSTIYTCRNAFAELDRFYKRLEFHHNLYVDSSWARRGKVTRWAYLAEVNNADINFGYGSTIREKGQEEVQGILRALAHYSLSPNVMHRDSLTVYCDSLSSIATMKNMSRKDILHNIRRLEGSTKKLKLMKLEFKWLRGHNGHWANEFSDRLARSASSPTDTVITNIMDEAREYYYKNKLEGIRYEGVPNEYK